MLVLKDILGGSLKITPENSNNLARQKIASKEFLLQVVSAARTKSIRHFQRRAVDRYQCRPELSERFGSHWSI